MLSYKRARGLAWRQIGQDAVIVDLKSNRAIGVNGPASVIWHSLAEDKCLDEIVQAMQAPVGSTGHIQNFLDQLVELALLERTGESSVVHAFSGGDESAWDAPSVLWTEQLEKFAGFCSKEPGNAPCGTEVSLS